MQHGEKRLRIARVICYLNAWFKGSLLHICWQLFSIYPSRAKSPVKNLTGDVFFSHHLEVPHHTTSPCSLLRYCSCALKLLLTPQVFNLQIGDNFCWVWMCAVIRQRQKYPRLHSFTTSVHFIFCNIAGNEVKLYISVNSFNFTTSILIACP